MTIHYYRGQPLGILLAAIRNDDPQAKGPNGLLKPIVVGRETTIRTPHAGTLYLPSTTRPAALPTMPEL